MRASNRPELLTAPFVRLAVWCGLLTGFGEVVLLGIQKFAMDRMIFLGSDTIWLAPATNAVYFLILGLVLAGVHRLWPTRVTWHTGLAIFCFVGFSAWLLMYSRLYPGAAFLLGAGLGIQAARMVARSSAGFFRLVRRSLPMLATMVLVIALGLRGWVTIQERRGLTQQPYPKPGSPNVLLIVLDAVRARNLSLYGYDRPTTPELEAWAARGVRFDLAVSTAPWSLPSHASIFTGQLPLRLKADWLVPLGTRYPTLAEVLTSQGYTTAGFVANTEYGGRPSGLSRGFMHYEGFRYSPGTAVMSTSLGRQLAGNQRLRRLLGWHQLLGRKHAADINHAFLNWVERRRERPFFVFLNYYDAHTPYLPPSPYDTIYGDTHRRHSFIFETGGSWTSTEIAAQRNAYDGAITWLDAHLGDLFTTLESRGLLDSTLVIVTSDHGEEFGEHGLMEHGHSLYLPSLHVPLIISYPLRVPAGRHVTTPVSLRDLPATIMDAVGLEADSPFPGRSLLRFMDSVPAPGVVEPDTVWASVRYAPGLPPDYPVSQGDMQSLLVGRYHYIRNGDGREELYDIEADPLEQQDLSRTNEVRAMLDQFRTQLSTMVSHERTRP